MPVEPLARARAIEANRPVIATGIAATNGGGSIIDARGTILATTVDGQVMVALAEIRG